MHYSAESSFNLVAHEFPGWIHCGEGAGPDRELITRDLVNNKGV